MSKKKKIFNSTIPFCRRFSSKVTYNTGNNVVQEFCFILTDFLLTLPSVAPVGLCFRRSPSRPPCLPLVSPSVVRLSLLFNCVPSQIQTQTAASLYRHHLAGMSPAWLGATVPLTPPAGTPPAIVFVHADPERRGFSTCSLGTWRAPPTVGSVCHQDSAQPPATLRQVRRSRL